MNADYLRFFQLVASAMAKREDSQVVPNVPFDVDQLRDIEDRLRVRGNLAAYGAATMEGLKLPMDAEYYLLDLNPGNESSSVNVTGFTRDQRDQAYAEYAEADRALREEGGGRQVVLVSGASLAQLRKGFPNYFMDSRDFTYFVDEILGA
jgi:hypothetical protein